MVKKQDLKRLIFPFKWINKMINWFINIFLTFKDIGQEINEKFTTKVVANNSELRDNLMKLNVEMNNLKCICCGKKINNLDEIKGVIKHKGRIYAYHKDLKCEVDAHYELAS